MRAPTIVAEIGCNHRGELSTALRMVEVLARYCREHFQLDGSEPDVVAKFQKRTPRLTPSDFERPHPNPYHSYGASYGAHREALELTREDHGVLARTCELEGIGYASSVWDSQAASDIRAVGPRWIKIPSARNRDFELIDQVADQWAGEIHLSLGMVRRAEVFQVVDHLVSIGAASRAVLYACTSAYPVSFTDVRLGEIEWLTEEFGSVVRSIGFSGHHHGIAVDMVAASMGVSHIERHFTLNRTWRGTDHAASLEPDGLRRLIRDVRAACQAMGTKGDDMLDCEAAQREKLARVVEVA